MYLIEKPTSDPKNSQSLLNIQGACVECEYVDILESQAKEYLHSPISVSIVDNPENLKNLGTVPLGKLDGFNRKDKLKLAGKAISEMLLSEDDPLRCYKPSGCPLKVPDLLMQRIIGTEAYLGLPTLTNENKREVIETPVVINRRSSDEIVSDYINDAFTKRNNNYEIGEVIVSNEDGSITTLFVRKLPKTN